LLVWCITCGIFLTDFVKLRVVEQVCTQVLETTSEAGDTTATKWIEEIVEVENEKYADKTMRGRDWLADIARHKGPSQKNDADPTGTAVAVTTEKRFEFGKVGPKHKLNETVPWVELPASDQTRLNAKLEEVRAAALTIRVQNSNWEVVHKQNVSAAEQEVQTKIAAMRHSVENATVDAQASGNVELAVRALKEGQASVRQALNALERTDYPLDRTEAYDMLNGRMFELRDLGDVLDVDTRELPVTWRIELDWMLQEWRHVRRVTKCLLCARMIFEDAQETHTQNWTVCCETGLADPSDVAAAGGGTSMGGSTAIVCEFTGVTIDPEDDDLNEGCKECPVRTPRMHAVSAGVDRLVWVHETIGRLWKVITTSDYAIYQHRYYLSESPTSLRLISTFHLNNNIIAEMPRPQNACKSPSTFADYTMNSNTSGPPYRIL
jgi:hypothetical protein